MSVPRTYALAALALAVSHTFAADALPPGFTTDSQGNPVLNSSGECWRNSAWTPGMAGACDPALRAGTPAPVATGSMTDAARADAAGTPAQASGRSGLATGSDRMPGTGLTDSSGQPVTSGFGDCWGTGFSAPGAACPAPVAGATATPDASGPSTAAPPSAPAAAAAPAAGLSTARPPISARGNPGYLTDSNGMVVRSSDGQCWRTGSWSPALATVVGCDGVLAKALPVPAPAPSPRPAAVPESAAPRPPDTVAPSSSSTPAAPVPAPAPTPVPTPPAAAAPETGRASPTPPVPVPAPPAPAPSAQLDPSGQATEVAPATQPKAEKVTLETDTYFDFDKASLKPNGQRKLDELASRLSTMALEVVVAVGHTDATGTDAYNRDLSQRRARSVKDYLVKKGVPAEKIFTDGKGERQPVASNQTREGRAQNRRVEVELVGIRR